MRQIDRVGNNIKPNPRMRQIDRVNSERPYNYDATLPIDEKDIPLLKEIESREQEVIPFLYTRSAKQEEAIKILEENISHGIYCNSYMLLSSAYNQRKEYDKELEVLKKAANFFEKENLEIPRRLLMRLQSAERSQKLEIIVNNNEKGRKLEKEGDIDGAIKAYQENLDIRAHSPFCYDRLCIIYRRRKDYKSEIDVINLAIDVYTEQGFNPSAIDKLNKRLEKAKKLYEKDKAQTKLV